MDLTSAAQELYGAAPDDFMDTRRRLVQEARQGGDAALAKEIGALRRPTLPAWAVNLLSRSAADELERLLDVGARMREAWSSGGDIAGLEQRRGELVASLVRRALELADEGGHPLRDAAVREVEDTLQAATVDADVAGEVEQGRLTRPRSHTGFVPAAGFAAAAPPPKKAREPGKQQGAQEREERPRRSRAAAERARERAEEAERELAEREREVAEARDERDAADTEAGRLRRELDRAVRRQEAAEEHLEKAEHRRDKAAEAAEQARRRVGAD
ncbi:hypothetical protein [Spirillospora sp. NPDC029432]|uniref:hypothetical protein n=1 Tax=Spirillospora sp. NPDC029432 TaxID=3154599 RepID=UPI003455E387